MKIRCNAILFLQHFYKDTHFLKNYTCETKILSKILKTTSFGNLCLENGKNKQQQTMKIKISLRKFTQPINHYFSSMTRLKNNISVVAQFGTVKTK